MGTNDDLLDDMIKNCKKPEDLIGENGLLKQLYRKSLEQKMQTEMTEHPGYRMYSSGSKK